MFGNIPFLGNSLFGSSSSQRSGETQPFPVHHGELGTSVLSTTTEMDHNGRTLHSFPFLSRMSKSGLPVNDTNMLKGAAPGDAGKSPMSLEFGSPNSPMKEHHRKQLSAQIHVYEAFRRGVLPPKPHLQIALGIYNTKEDGPRREMMNHRGKEIFISNIINNPAVPGDAGKSPTSLDFCSPHSLMKEHHIRQLKAQIYVNDAFRRGMLPSKLHLQIALENFNTKEDGPRMEMMNHKGKEIFTSSASNNPQNKVPVRRTVKSRKTEFSYQQAAEQMSSVMARNQNMTPEMLRWTKIGNRNEAARVSNHSFLAMHESGSERNCVQGNTDLSSNLPSFQSRVIRKSIPTMISEHHVVMAKKDANILVQNVSEGPRYSFDDGCGTDDDGLQENSSPFEVVSDQGDGDMSFCAASRPPPKYTTSEKLIRDQRKRKRLEDQNWVLKQQKTDHRIAACFVKLKGAVSLSKDTSTKTKSVIELKKLKLLDLQRRLRSEILCDYFKPITNEMDNLKSAKKQMISTKQVERKEQRMKEERQKKIRGKQKEFFSELEVHKERLDDVFKMKRERWKGYNKHIRDYHKKKERFHREKIDKIQREKINLLKINDVEGYLRMVKDVKSDRVKQLLKETDKYLSQLGSKLQDAKTTSRRLEAVGDDSQGTNVIENYDFHLDNEDDADQAKHYMESNEKYYLMAHSVKESISEQPTSLEGGKLRDYQMNGLRWLVSLYNNNLNGILADEMGLGKTVQVISLICYLMEARKDHGPFLVVVPSSVLPGWDSEINFWAPGINKVVYCGTPDERRRLFKERIIHQKFNVLLTTYEYLMNKHDRPKLSKVMWHYIIIDEGHRIKNASCKLNADLKHYRSSHRLLLTGTPLQNNLEELWALLNFLLPNIFNSSDDFSQWFNKPFEGSGDNSADEALLSEEENLLIINRLHQVLRPFVLRRLKHKVEKELPVKIERLIRCEASAYQKLLMKRVEDNLGAIGSSKARSVHNSVVELRNICNHPYLSQLHAEEVHGYLPNHYLPKIVRFCGKLEMLDRLLPKLKATDHRVLFFSTMTRLLDVMENYLTMKRYQYLRLDGHTSGRDRGGLIDKFNQPGSPFFIFLLSIRAGGVGVNLQAADTVIIFDTDWNPQVDLQAQARAHRIGQKKDVLVLRFETVKSVEEQVRASAEHKLGVANQSITAGFFDNNTTAEDRREYLESLLRESKKEEPAPVLNDDALNETIARSESEIEVFKSVDRERQEEEMKMWKKIVIEQGNSGSEPIPPLPSRLITDDDLNSFCEVMKIYEVPNVTVAVSDGGKRKRGSLGNLDTQHYGRGKRAREVQSYEEKWMEEEFEKLCEAEPPESPKLKGEILENNSLILAGETAIVTEAGVAKTEISAPAIVSPQPPAIVSPQPTTPVSPSSPAIVSPQPSVAVPTEQSKFVTPTKRGRGRPRKITGTPPSPIIPAAHEAKKAEIGSVGAVSISSTESASSSDALLSGSLKSVSKEQYSCNDPSAPLSLSSVPLRTQTIPGSSPLASTQGRGEMQKTQGRAEAPSRSGKKKAELPADVFAPQLSLEQIESGSFSMSVHEFTASSRTEKVDSISQGEKTISPAPISCLDSTPVALVVKADHENKNPVCSVVPVLPTEISKVKMVTEVRPISNNPAETGSSSVFAVPAVMNNSGKMIQFGVGVVSPTTSTPSPRFDPISTQSIPSDISATYQPRGWGLRRARCRRPQNEEGSPPDREKERDTLSCQDSNAGEVQASALVSPGRSSSPTKRTKKILDVEQTNVVQVPASGVLASNILSWNKFGSQMETDANEISAIPSENINSQKSGVDTERGKMNDICSEKIDSQKPETEVETLEMRAISVHKVLSQKLETDIQSPKKSNITSDNIEPQKSETDEQAQGKRSIPLGNIEPQKSAKDKQVQEMSGISSKIIDSKRPETDGQTLEIRGISADNVESQKLETDGASLKMSTITLDKIEPQKSETDEQAQEMHSLFSDNIEPQISGTDKQAQETSSITLKKIDSPKLEADVQTLEIRAISAQQIQSQKLETDRQSLKMSTITSDQTEPHKSGIDKQAQDMIDLTSEKDPSPNKTDARGIEMKLVRNKIAKSEAVDSNFLQEKQSFQTLQSPPAVILPEAEKTGEDKVLKPEELKEETLVTADTFSSPIEVLQATTLVCPASNSVSASTTRLIQVVEISNIQTLGSEGHPANILSSNKDEFSGPETETQEINVIPSGNIYSQKLEANEQPQELSGISSSKIGSQNLETDAQPHEIQAMASDKVVSEEIENDCQALEMYALPIDNNGIQKVDTKAECTWVSPHSHLSDVSQLEYEAACSDIVMNLCEGPLEKENSHINAIPSENIGSEKLESNEQPREISDISSDICFQNPETDVQQHVVRASNASDTFSSPIEVLQATMLVCPGSNSVAASTTRLIQVVEISNDIQTLGSEGHPANILSSNKDEFPGSETEAQEINVIPSENIYSQKLEANEQPQEVSGISSSKIGSQNLETDAQPHEKQAMASDKVVSEEIENDSQTLEMYALPIDNNGIQKLDTITEYTLVSPHSNLSDVSQLEYEAAGSDFVTNLCERPLEKENSQINAKPSENIDYQKPESNEQPREISDISSDICFQNPETDVQPRMVRASNASGSENETSIVKEDTMQTDSLLKNDMPCMEASPDATGLEVESSKC